MTKAQAPCLYGGVSTEPPESTPAVELTPQRAPDGRFAPGQSGNPGGQPKAIGILRAAAREHTLAAVGVLVEGLSATRHVGEDTEVPDWAARITAANALLDRGYGKPREFVEIDTHSTDAAHLAAELAALRRNPDTAGALLILAEASASMTALPGKD